MNRLRRLFQLLILSAALGLALIAIWQPRLPRPVIPETRAPLTGTIDRVLVEKAARRMTVFRNGEALRTYPVALGFAPIGDKVRQGDGKTPEGTFRIDRRNAGSRFHLSLGIDYPQRDDLVRARAGGYSPGGDIFIHGQPNALRGMATLTHDWTAGCIALANADMEEVWRVTKGMHVTVEIKP